MQFTKMQGAGNDYIYLNCLQGAPKDPNALSVQLSNRHFGVGADGLVLILPGENGADFRMRMFNTDGSEGKMCGNAIRCVGKYVYDRGFTDKTTLTVQTLSGLKTLELFVEKGKVRRVRVDMGKAELLAKKVPVEAEEEKVIDKPAVIAGHHVNITCVSMGNPHCVVFFEEIDLLPLEKLGPQFERHQMFPDRVNTEFIRVIDRRTLQMRVWERGSGETMACGTGACAAAVAATECGYVDAGEDITVQLRGGDLIIRYLEDGTVLMTGAAEFVYDGQLLDERVDG